MSFEWRYVVRPDGSFWRTPNIDGSLDSMTDEELQRMGSVLDRHRDDEEPACSQCGREVVLHWRTPAPGAMLELCEDCDGHRPAAADLIRWKRDPARRAVDLPLLFAMWETEAMGWVYMGPESAP
ncbi:hypothetical protein AQJ23_16160 [Streptomyces antibioticus]|nr:DUF6300 family protein [Streptomyces antibioticus]KUN25923.1 hypothetical protein AQJ23_16160 [Streptomyces antibioticus]